MHLPPDKHVFGGKRNLLVAVSDVGADGIHDLVFGKIDLRVQIGHAKLATTPAAGCHFDHAESRARVGKEDRLALHRMFDFNLARQFLSLDRLSKKLQRLDRFAAPFDDAIDAQFFVSICLDDLPAARTTDDDFKILSKRARLDFSQTSLARNES